MSRKLAKILQLVNIIAMVILILAFQKYLVAVYVIGIVGIIFSILLCYFLRCPCCGRWPRRGDFWNEYCPGCGNRLNDE